jgi:hypothetical protein
LICRKGATDSWIVRFADGYLPAAFFIVVSFPHGNQDRLRHINAQIGVRGDDRRWRRGATCLKSNGDTYDDP